MLYPSVACLVLVVVGVLRSDSLCHLLVVVHHSWPVHHNLRGCHPLVELLLAVALVHRDPVVVLALVLDLLDLCLSRHILPMFLVVGSLHIGPAAVVDNRDQVDLVKQVCLVLLVVAVADILDRSLVAVEAHRRRLDCSRNRRADTVDHSLRRLSDLAEDSSESHLKGTDVVEQVGVVGVLRHRDAAALGCMPLCWLCMCLAAAVYTA